MPGETTASGSLFDSARTTNLAFKSEVSAVQEQLWADDWEVVQYGDTPEACGDDSYSFSLRRDLPLPDATGWRLPEEPSAMRDRLARWLEDAGYSDVTGLSYTDGVDELTLTARNENAGIAELTIQFHPGDVQDGISLTATGTCHPGSARDLTAELFPGFYENSSLEWPPPATERPDATPIFGYDEDGNPR